MYIATPTPESIPKVDNGHEKDDCHMCMCMKPVCSPLQLMDSAAGWSAQIARTGVIASVWD